MPENNKKSKYVTYVNANGLKVCIKRNNILYFYQNEKTIITPGHEAETVYYQLIIKVPQGNSFTETFDTLQACNELYDVIDSQLN